MLLIGSRAAAMQTEFHRPVKDWDIVASRRDIDAWYAANREHITQIRFSDQVPNTSIKHAFKHKNLGWVEFENADLIVSARLLLEAAQQDSAQVVIGQTVHIGNSKPIQVANLATLFTIKDSHIYQPVRWEKNIRDWHFLRQFKNDLTDIALYDFHAKRRHETKIRHPNLNQSNQDFFGMSDGKVTQKFPHDAVHCAVACDPYVPSFSKMKRDQTKAWCEADLFFEKLTESERLACVLEEAWVIAIERKLTIDENTMTPREAFEWALMRVCTTLCSGFFRDYAIQNWDILVHGGRTLYWMRFKDRIDHVMKTGMWREYYEGEKV